MGSLDVLSPWLSAAGESFGKCFNIQVEGVDSADFSREPEASSSPSVSYNRAIPKPPPCPPKVVTSAKCRNRFSGYSSVLNEIKDKWDRLFKEGYRADVRVLTDLSSHPPTGSDIYIPAHSNVLSIASPVLKNILEHSNVKNGMRCIKICGVPYEAVYIFIRFLYSACYKEDEMKKFILPLLVLSHSYSVPSLKKVCVDILENGWLTKDNVIDALQLARNCDAPRLSLTCVRMVVKDLKSISSTEGWKVMRRANPALEQELVEAVVEADSRIQERTRRKEEKKVYLQLHEAMEALLHICREGCRTIGPRDKALKGSQGACRFSACKGLESLVRHFSNCKTRVPGRCVHCKRMWQLLELHSRMCYEPDSCKVPLCRHFKEKMRLKTKKDEAKWKMLVSKVVAARNMLGPFSAHRIGLL